MKRLEQDAPVQPHAEEAFPERLVLEVEDAPAGGGLAQELGHARAAREHSLGQPQLDSRLLGMIERKLCSSG